MDIGGKLSQQRSLGEVGLFTPIMQNDSTLLFSDIRFRPDNQGSKEGNFGLGLRHMTAHDFNLGAYGYFDVRGTAHGNTFTQATLGLEALALTWSLRGNIYLPFGKTTQDATALDVFRLDGTSVVYQAGLEHAMAGLDIEFGLPIPVLGPEKGTSLNLYAGAYHFANRSAGLPDMTGLRGRAELVLDSPSFLPAGAQFAIGGEIQHDAPRGTQAALTARLKVPFGGKSTNLSPQERLVTSSIVRDVDIVTQAGRSVTPETITTTANGSTFTVINSESTAGANLATALSNAGLHSTVLLAGDFNIGNGTIQTRFGQTVTGQLTVQTSTGKTATIAPGATIRTLNSTNGIIVQAGGTVSYLALQTDMTNNDGHYGILVADGATNVTIANNSITVRHTGANGAVGVAVGSNAAADIRNNQIYVTGAGGATSAFSIAFNATATVHGNTFSASGGTSNHAARIGTNATISAGSTHNSVLAGSCTGTSLSGAIEFVDGTSCP